eukprot:m.10515 g.10515  ORF g.10515 m.10515 type:complete len:89 (-) comp2753_c0_seq2:206-472(-)
MSLFQQKKTSLLDCACHPTGSQPVVAAPGEVKFVDDMVAKHGDDYQAMARDLKLNVYQHTARQIEHKVKRVQKTMALAAKYGVDTEAV